MILAIFLFTAPPVIAQVDSVKADEFFKEAKELCEREHGRLWGISLCGPMVIADAVSGTIATNQTAPDEPRPRVLGYANAALEWGDERWATFVWQMIPQDQHARGRMMMHELFHRVQPQLGLYITSSEGAPDHLDSLEGRYWMQLEWRALIWALESSGPERIEAVRDALTFRRHRHSLFPGAAESERVIEINEGLAQYTGTAAAFPSADEAILDAIEQLKQAPVHESFVRTFAYPSGAAYGLLLDEWKPGWTRQVTAEDDLGDFLSAVSGIKSATDVDRLTERYGGTDLWEVEQEREAKQQAYIAELRAKFVDGPVLVLPRGRNASFITTGITPIPDIGTIYPNFRVSGEWGSITAGQVLMSPDGNTLIVPAPTSVDSDTLAGEDWTVFLEAGWIVIPGPRDGDFSVVKKENQTESEMDINKQAMESKILGLRTAIYNVGDLQTAKEWYSSAFQTEPYYDESYYVGYNIGGFELGLLPDSTAAQDKSEGVVAYWGVDDIESEYNRIIGLGAVGHEPPKNVGGEIMVATVKDPWGNVIGLIYNPEFKIGSE